MQHKCKVTVIDKKVFSDLQEKFLADKKSGECPFYKIDDEFIFERYGDEDTFWTMGKGSQCSEAWDCISRYIYTALQGGSIMRNWTNNENFMIACCNDGTRPVIFKIERIDYKVLKVDTDKIGQEKIIFALKNVEGIRNAEYRADKNFIEIFMNKNNEVSDEKIIETVNSVGDFKIFAID